MKFVNTTFNSISLKRRTREEDIYILMPYQLRNRIDVNDLAGVFNLDKAEIKGKIIETVELNHTYVDDNKIIKAISEVTNIKDKITFSKTIREKRNKIIYKNTSNMR